ncbi:MAG: Ig-like domain-containing protein [Clostridia bacterium]
MPFIKKKTEGGWAAKLAKLATAITLVLPTGFLPQFSHAQTVKVKPIVTDSMSWATRDLSADTQTTFHFDLAGRFGGYSGLGLASSNDSLASGELAGTVAAITVKQPGTAVFTISGTDGNGVLVNDTFSVEIAKLGDFTGDGIVTTADSLFITRYLSGKVTVKEDEKMMLDINGDGKITSADAVALTNLYINGSGGGSTTIDYRATFRDVNDPPAARDVSLTGDVEFGQPLSGQYSYFDIENKLEGTSLLQWYSGNSADGSDKMKIAGATSSTYTITEQDAGKYLFFGVTPVEAGGMQGAEVVSGPSAQVSSTVNPVISLLSPSNGEQEIDPNRQTLDITFNKAVTAANKMITIRKKADGSAVITYAANDTTKVSLVGKKVGLSISGLQESTAYHVEIESGAFMDATNNPFEGLAGSGGWSFTTWDKTAPQIGTLLPAKDATAVDPALASASLTFDEDVTAIQDKNVTIHKAADDSVLATYAATDSAHVTVSGKSVTIKLPALEDLTAYYIQVDAGAFADASGNPFAGLAGSSAWKFTTADKTAPSIAELTPASGATGVDVQLASLQMKFSEDVQAVSNKFITLRKTADQSEVAKYATTDTTHVTVSGKVVTIQLPALMENAAYAIELDAGAFADSDGNQTAGMSGASAWTFTTADVPPTALTLVPANGATGVQADIGQISMTFSENVQAVSGKNVTLRKADGTAVVTYAANDSTNVSINGSQASIQLPDLELATHYYVEVDSGAFEDMTGNPFAGITDSSSWTFETNNGVALAISAESDPVQLTEDNLDAALITLSVTGDTFKDEATTEDFALINAPLGLDIALAYVSGGKAYVLLEHSWSPFAADITNFAIEAKATAMTKGQAVVSQSMTIAKVAQTPSIYFSEYADGGDGRIAFEVYNGTGVEIKGTDGYEIEVQYEKANNKLAKSYPIGQIFPGNLYIAINFTFYDVMDITPIWYFNQEMELYLPNTYAVTAILLKKNGQVIDVLGTPDASSGTQFLADGGTIVRRHGTIGGMSQFTMSHWDKYPKGTYQYLGTHTP